MVFTAWIMCEIVSDLTIAGMMTLLLLDLKRGAGIASYAQSSLLKPIKVSERIIYSPRTNTLLNRLVLYAVSTGFITALFSVAIAVGLRTANTPIMSIIGSLYGGSKLY